MIEPTAGDKPPPYSARDKRKQVNAYARVWRPSSVDDGLMPLAYVIRGGGSRSTKVQIGPEVFTRLSAAQTIAGLSAAP